MLNIEYSGQFKRDLKKAKKRKSARKTWIKLNNPLDY